MRLFTKAKNMIPNKRDELLKELGVSTEKPKSSHEKAKALLFLVNVRCSLDPSKEERLKLDRTLLREISFPFQLAS